VGGIDSFLVSVRDALGLDVSLDVLRGIFWMVAAVVAIVVAYRVIMAVLRGLEKAGLFAKRQIDQKFWRDAGKLATVISFLLFVLAYGFYSQEQRRTVGQALADLVREHLDAVLPLAVLTQWVLLLLFWFGFGLLVNVPLRSLLKPLEVVWAFVVLTGQVLLYTVVMMSLVEGSVTGAVLGAGALFGSIYLLLVGATATQRRQWSASAASGRRFARLVYGWGAGRSRWLPPPLLVVVCVAGFGLLYGIISMVVGAVYVIGDRPPATMAGVVTVDLIVMAFVFLFVCYRFRADTLSEVEVPPALLHFVDFSLAISACAIAVVGLPNSPVTLGEVPVWLIAVGPPVIVAAMVFVMHLLRLRMTTPRWVACLVVAAVAGLLVGPAKIVLGYALGPLAALLPLPSL
jgi:hypothetical protein